MGRHRTFAALLGSMLLFCGCDSRASEEYRLYMSERSLAKICRDGTKIWSWRDKLYVVDGRQWPDAVVTTTLDRVCT